MHVRPIRHVDKSTKYDEDEEELFVQDKRHQFKYIVPRYSKNDRASIPTPTACNLEMCNLGFRTYKLKTVTSELAFEHKSNACFTTFLMETHATNYKHIQE